MKQSFCTVLVDLLKHETKLQLKSEIKKPLLKVDNFFRK